MFCRRSPHHRTLHPNRSAASTPAIARTRTANVTDREPERLTAFFTWMRQYVTRLMIRPARTIGSQGLSSLAGGLIVATLIVLFLYIGREILEPLVIAALLGFILAPLIRRLRGWGLWRVPSVIFTVAVRDRRHRRARLDHRVSGGSARRRASQVRDQSAHQDTGAGRRIADVELVGAGFRHAERPAERDLQASTIGRQRPGQKPLLVEVRQPEPKGLESIANVVRPLLSPLATTALAILFLMFILLAARGHSRSLSPPRRYCRPAAQHGGSRRRRRTTEPLFPDADHPQRRVWSCHWCRALAHRRSQRRAVGHSRRTHALRAVRRLDHRRLFPHRAGGGSRSWLEHGVGNSCTVHRRLSPLAGHVIEPVLYGQHTGLSPVAIVVSTLFWALLWGPIGLLLATPLTVCLVVLGRHIEALEFIEVLAGRRARLGAGGAILPATSRRRCHRGRRSSRKATEGAIPFRLLRQRADEGAGVGPNGCRSWQAARGQAVGDQGHDGGDRGRSCRPRGRSSRIPKKADRRPSDPDHPERSNSRPRLAGRSPRTLHRQPQPTGRGRRHHARPAPGEAWAAGQDTALRRRGFGKDPSRSMLWMRRWSASRISGRSAILLTCAFSFDV